MTIPDIYKRFLLCDGVSTDTRTIKEGVFFVAVHGRSNANKFAQEALKKGAKWAVVDDSKFLTDDRIILVEDTLETLQSLAAFHREQTNVKILAITGSNGKTTTKELVFRVLASKYSVTATEGNFNNHIGVPLTLLRIPGNMDFALVEMGANHLGEISFLCDIAKPNYGYITNFGKAHLEGFGGVEQVIKGKSELYDYLKSCGGVIFCNDEDSVQRDLCSNYKNTVKLFDSSSPIVVNTHKNSYPLTVEYRENIIRTQLVGNYNLSNIAAAIGIGVYFDVPLPAVINALESYNPNDNRSQLLCFGKVKVISDAYNANPSSMRKSIESFYNMKGEKLAVLGDMLELGKYSPEEHQTIVNLLEELKIKALLFGKHFCSTTTDIPKFENYKDLERHILNIKPGNNLIVLLKGSRGMELERLFRIFDKWI